MPVSKPSFTFRSGNVYKLLLIPVYLCGLFISWCVPRSKLRWVFGSGAGFGEGAVILAKHVQLVNPEADISWLAGDFQEAQLAEAAGFNAVPRSTVKGFWYTLRANYLVVTHGLGDVNRFGVFGGTIINLWHGTPLKRLHLDSPVTTGLGGARIFGQILQHMYRLGAGNVSLYVAGSVPAAERLRSAFRVEPGKVKVLGDPRLDTLSQQLVDPALRLAAREKLCSLLELPTVNSGEAIVLYAPTWRDGDNDPAVPTEAEAEHINDWAERAKVTVVFRTHPLGVGDYEPATGPRVRLLNPHTVKDLTPLLAGFDALITDYSSVAVDFSLTENPIVWFAPDLETYVSTRGLYEPLHATAEGLVHVDWQTTLEMLERVLTPASGARHASRLRSRRLANRFHAFPEGGAAARVCEAIYSAENPRSLLVSGPKVFFESFYGKQASCNPLAIDAEIARVRPEITRYWSVVNELVPVPDGSLGVLVGSPEWHAVRRDAKLLVVNDWLRYGFKRRTGQHVLQTWHGTPLKHIALGRPGLSLRTKFAIRRESAKWSVALSQNPHSSRVLRESYKFQKEILELGYPRTDRLAQSRSGEQRIPSVSQSARRRLDIPEGKHVLLYAPTWRDHTTELIDTLDVNWLADQLGESWIVLIRGHSRTSGYRRRIPDSQLLRDVTGVSDVNDLLLAADMLVTDYSSVMFDASAALIPTMFYVPDFAWYRDEERGFTFDFEAEAPGQLTTDPTVVLHAAVQLREHAHQAKWIREYTKQAHDWRHKFNACDDGQASSRVVSALIELKML